MTGPIRTLLAAPMAGSGVPAASGFKTIFIEGSPTFEDLARRQAIRVQNSTYVGATLTALGPMSSTLTLRTPVLYRQFGLWLKGALGAPVSSISGTTTSSGTVAHYFNLGPTTLPKFAFKYYENVYWKQVLNAQLNTIRLTGSAGENGALMAELAFIGAFGTKIDAPTVPDLEEDFNPAGPRELQATAGDDIADAISFTIDLNNNLTPFWVGRRAAGYKRAKRGLADAKFDGLFDFEDYDTDPSFVKMWYGSEDPGALIVDYLGGTHITGAGSAAYPELEFKFPDFKMETVGEPDDGPEVAQHVVGNGTYSGTNDPKGSFTVKLVNDREASYYADVES